MPILHQIRPDFQRKLDFLETRWEQLCAEARNAREPGLALQAIGERLLALEMAYKAYLSDALEPPDGYQAPCTCDDTIPFGPPCAACREE